MPIDCLTFSEFTRNELIEVLHCPPERVTAVPLAADASFTPRTVDSVTGTLPTLWPCLARLLPERRHRSSPRKQIDTLLDAFSGLPADLQRQFPLLLIGDRGWLSRVTHERIERLAAAGMARYLGYVPQDDLPLLYNGAAACLYPSVYEGFGLPAVEAMASGTPLITTTAASLPEVCGDGAMLVPSGDCAALGEALYALLTDPPRAAALAARGMAAARQFSWERTVTETARAYRQVLDA